ncbi:hypothetical protein A4H97_18165 [Niastella yeongjuensis]|uniref:Serine protease n=1 Tax=Niastella yeongjuensis TaxID=354355 RepID=A0A1V9DXP5_9BACT|nr:DNA/RNA non-specific endonuclease [Niastella yeongjuensis]OQP38647.1 hypothetical protein A4H97_18165 [Niastella yeongjuensis]SEO38176.1 endonuclease G [Niastella yeongjuensis]
MPIEKIDNRLRKLLASIENNDQQLSKELKSKRKDANILTKARSLAPQILETVNESFVESMPLDDFTEAVILPVGRPVLTIFHNDAELTFTDPESEIWRERLINARSTLAGVIPSVGRVEVANHPIYDWLGTGWLVDKNIIVTNRHVAEIFGKSTGFEFDFRLNATGQKMGSSIDLLQEDNNPAKALFKVQKILHIEPEPGPDIAFLLVDQTQGILPSELLLSTDTISADSNVAVIGYPAKDSRMPDVALMERLFGNVYDKKRLAPGKITGVQPARLLHDCSTLGGCSGGAVVDLGTGGIVGLHFAGRFMESNFAVPAKIVREVLSRVTKLPGSNGNGKLAAASNGKPVKPNQSPASETTVSKTDLQAAPPTNNKQDNQCTFTIPLQITVSIGQPSIVAQTQAPVNTASAATHVKSADEIDNDELIMEGRAEDFDDREGYKEDFLGDGFEVPLPEANSERRKNDLLTYTNKGNEDHVLRYEHFSVSMSKARRMCIFSACNVDGRTATGGLDRVPWRLDPRIPKEAQIIKECYGAPPKFSRGHMTRREDPVWGNTTAKSLGNADSMTVTNVTPQMQTFNAPVWLALENYALQHARDDKMRISVFTGPILKSNDPVKFGVKVPVEFWKVIAFIHDETGELSATGYRMSQKDHLPEEEFVFGEFETAQLSIKKIENLTGLSFGFLSDHDPLNNANEAFEGVDIKDPPLTDVREIKFK